MENGEKTKSKRDKTWFIKIGIFALVALVMVGLAGSSFYFYRQYKKAGEIKTPDTRSETAILTDEIKNFMDLPDEIPTLATVTDSEKAKEQPFFTNAQNGDKVLIYASNKKVILYRPITHKIIEVSTVSEATGSSVPADQVAEVQNNVAEIPFNTQASVNTDIPAENNQADVETLIKVAVYNGGGIKGLAQKTGATLAIIMPEIIISEKTNATGSYQKTLVIDLSGQRGELAQKIAETLGGEVGTFPEDEIKPEADILVIAGKTVNSE